MLSPRSTAGLLELYRTYSKVLVWFNITPAAIRIPLYLGKAETAVQPSTLSLRQVSPMSSCSEYQATLGLLVAQALKLF